jgi:beta-aspartyl-peptidase (threonine type)
MRYIIALIFIVSLAINACQDTKSADAEIVDDNIKEAGPITLVIHGGAGTIRKENMSPEMEAAYMEKLSEALDTGYGVLEEGGSAIECVIATIQVMEESPLFNAGIGAVFTHDGTNELDASIMDGGSGQAGAVAGVKTIKSPIAAAYEVMTNSNHVMLTGTGAEVFAKERGLEIVDPEYFFTERRFNSLQRIIDQEKTELDHSGEEDEDKSTSMWMDITDKKYGTVGAAALDQYGNIAAGTSTGGMTNKKYGRVGDAPIIGAGTFADNESCAISATGHGEFFIRNVVAHDIAARMQYGGKSLQEAADEVVMDKLVKIEGSGGVIGLDRQGNITMTFNSEGMYRGYINEKGNPVVKIYKN